MKTFLGFVLATVALSLTGCGCCDREPQCCEQPPKPRCCQPRPTCPQPCCPPRCETRYMDNNCCY